MCPLVSKLMYIIELVKVLEKYGDDPKKVLNDMLGNVLIKDQVITDERIRNILTGLSSEVTHSYAVASGRKLLSDVIKNLALELKQGLTKRYTDISKYGQVLDDSLKPIKEMLLSDAMETRWLSVDRDEMYQKYFLQRLERDFLQTLNSSVWGIGFVITMEKLIIIYRYYINRVLEKDLVKDIHTINTAMADIADLAKKIDNIEMIVPSNLIEELDTESKIKDFNYIVPILSQQDTGKLLKDIAVETPDIDNTDAIVVLPGLRDLQTRLNKLYQKLEGDIHTVKNVLETGYPVYLQDILDIATNQFDKIIDQFESYNITDEEYKRKITSVINLFIRLVDMDRKMTDIANTTANELSSVTGNYLALFQLYNIMLAYSLDIKTVNAKIGPNR